MLSKREEERNHVVEECRSLEMGGGCCEEAERRGQYVCSLVCDFSLFLHAVDNDLG